MPRFSWFYLAPLTAGAVLSFSAPANAGLTIHVEQDFGVVTNGGADFGLGFSGRIGYRIGLGPLWIAPELGGGYLSFGEVGANSIHPSRVYGGGRLGLGGFVQPQIYGHAGYGWMGGVRDISFRGAMFEVGGALDLRVIPLLGIGVHAGYTSNDSINEGLLGRGAINWVNFGVHAGLTF